MQVRLLLFGILRDLLGAHERVMDMQAGATAGELVEVCRAEARSGAAVWDSIAVAVNQEYAERGRVLAEGDEVALLPPVSGGVSR